MLCENYTHRSTRRQYAPKQFSKASVTKDAGRHISYENSSVFQVFDCAIRSYAYVRHHQRYHQSCLSSQT